MKTAILTSFLASSASAAGISATAVLKQHEALHQKRFAAQIKTELEAARKAGTLKARKERNLYSNTKFLNFHYYSDDTCEAKSWASGGYGVGACIPLSGGGSFMYTGCDGSGDTLSLDIEVYSSVSDCSGSEDSSNTLTPNNGECTDQSSVDDDYALLDDRFVIFGDDDPTYGPSMGSSYQILTCDDKINKPTGLWRSAYEDATCDSMVGYYGLNDGGCVPFNTPGGRVYVIPNCEGSITKITDTDDCSGENVVDDDPFDDDDDYEDDDAGKCLQFPAVNDDYAYPGNYFSHEEASCDDDDDDLCFAGSETVLLESGEIKSLADVAVGDMVQVVGADGHLKFSEVVFLPHPANTDRAVFTELQLASGNSLRATAAHLVMAGSCEEDSFKLTAMKYVSMGSCVQTASGEADEVTGSDVVVDHGVYTLVTKEASGLVVVNGVRASSFAHNHWLANQYYNIHRAVYQVAPALLKHRNVIAANLIVGDIALSL